MGSVIGIFCARLQWMQTCIEKNHFHISEKLLRTSMCQPMRGLGCQKFLNCRSQWARTKKREAIVGNLLSDGRNEETQAGLQHPKCMSEINVGIHSS